MPYFIIGRQFLGLRPQGDGAWRSMPMQGLVITSTRLFTPGKRKEFANSNVHQRSGPRHLCSGSVESANYRTF